MSLSAHTPEARASLRRARRRRWATRFDTLLALVLAALVVAGGHYLASRHFVRADWTQKKFYSLTAETAALLDGLTQEVRITVLFKSGEDLLADLDNLLREYQAASPRVRYVRVDPDRDLARVEELAKRHPDLTEANVVLVEAGGRHAVLKRDDLAEYDYSPMAAGKAPILLGFRGEQAVSTAILRVQRSRAPVVCFLTGHGEKSPEGFERGGLSELARLIRQAGVDVREFQFGEERGLPPDTDLVVVAGPARRFAQTELDLFQRYLERNGRAMILLGSGVETGLEPLLLRWGVKVGDDVVYDPTRTLTGRDLVLSPEPKHPILANLRRIALVFYRPRSVDPVSVNPEAEGADRPHAVRLADCTDGGWAETDYQTPNFRYDPGRGDRPGPVGVAVAVERGPMGGLDVQIRPTRLVVAGDATFVSNGAMVSGNSDFFISAMNWLVERPELMAIAPRKLEQVKLELTTREQGGVGLAVIIGIPALVGLMGLAVWWRRRS